MACLITGCDCVKVDLFNVCSLISAAFTTAEVDWNILVQYRPTCHIEWDCFGRGGGGIRE